MSVSLVCRSVILAAYLTVLVVHGEPGPAAILLAVATAGIWLAALVRDGYARTGSATAIAGVKPGAGLPNQ